MAIRVKTFETTPNPNALKCVLDRSVSEGRRSFGSAGGGVAGDASSEGDPVASALMRVEGVAGVMLMGDWLTVLKEPGVAWRTVKARVERALEGVE
jgi:hypothetical protein